MNPAGQGNASGLEVACTFASGASAGLNFTMTDAYDATSGGLGPASGAVYHYGEARQVAVTGTRNGAAPGTIVGSVIKSCVTNATAAAIACGPAPQVAPRMSPVGNLAFSAADMNHSVEFATSSATFTGQFINPGSFIKALTGTAATLSKPLISAGSPTCPGTYAVNCTTSVANVLVSNGTNRAVVDGETTAGSAVVTSATIHFCGGSSACTGPSDIGARLSGGDLPDGATILSIQSATQATLQCIACGAGFTGVTTPAVANTLPLTIDPATPPTSNRYVTDGSFSGAGGNTITSASATFANTDIGMPVTGTGIPAGKRISAVPSATVATLTGAGTAPAGTHPFTLGKATKTAPANNDVVGTLAIELIVNPAVSPTSPPCLANKVSGFHIPLQWRPPGSYGLANNNSTHVEGHIVPGTSIGQLIFNTASTSFAGFLHQNVTVSGGNPTTAGYFFKIEFAPITVGVCPGKPLAETLSMIGISVKQAQNPTFTGGGGGGFRALSTIPDSHSVLFTGSTGANVVTGGSDPTDANACTLNSPNVIQIGC